jgi:hypothetical protein
MKKIFLALGCCFALISADSGKIISTPANIIPNPILSAPTINDYQSRLKLADQDVKNAQEDLLDELNLDVTIFNYDRSGHKALAKEMREKAQIRSLAKFKARNKYNKLENFSEEVRDQLQKNPNIEIFTVDNLSKKEGTDTRTMAQKVFIESKLANNSGIIMREIGKIVNADLNNKTLLKAYVDRKLEKECIVYIPFKISLPYKWLRFVYATDILDLYFKFSQKAEIKADLWSAAHCKECGSQLIDYFKQMQEQSPSGSCPDIAERIDNLS